jgi:DNA helicase II / ATP-dependent DNA helicase PcrA
MRVPKCDVCGKPARGGRQIGTFYACPECIALAEQPEQTPFEKALAELPHPQMESLNVLPTSAMVPKFSDKLKQSQASAAPHMVVRAYAGTGKTFSDIVGCAWAFAPQIWPRVLERLGNITPSDEQLAIWECFKLGAGSTSSITYCAFNKKIVTEFGEKWGWLAEMLKAAQVNLTFATVNSMGNQSCYRAFGRMKVTDEHVERLLAEHMEMDLWDLRRKSPVLVSAVKELTSLCKLTLTGWTRESGFKPENVDDYELDKLASHYNIELNGRRDQVYDLVPTMLRKCLRPAGTIDFNDQNWLPVVLNLPISKSHFLMVDEGQDLPRCKQEYVIRAGDRICVVGDVFQAIYGFAGADVESIPRMTELLGADPRGVEVLKLTQTRRCGQVIVAEANLTLQQICHEYGDEYVPFTAHESNPLGVVERSTLAKYAESLQDGDMVLCRTNAPLIGQALKRIKQGKKAVVWGRDFGKGLIDFVKKAKTENVAELMEFAQLWAERETQKESRKGEPNEAKLIAIQERVDCIDVFIKDEIEVATAERRVPTASGVVEKMELVFSGKECPRCHQHFNEELDRCPRNECKTETDPATGWKVGPKLLTPKGVAYASVHKSKGAEAKKVAVLLVRGASMPHPMAKSRWERRQELHIKYVAQTRGIETLVYVTD